MIDYDVQNTSTEPFQFDLNEKNMDFYNFKDHLAKLCLSVKGRLWVPPLTVCELPQAGVKPWPPGWKSRA